MIDDLKTIKSLYGEKMSHLCRELFPTLLEKPGELSNLMQKLFEPQKFLYEDIIMNGAKEGFKNYVIGYCSTPPPQFKTDKTPTELLSEVGYDLYECKTEEDIQSFKKYYEPHEELCTFWGGRLNRCYVFFAVKKDVDKIKREDFKTTKRQDEYGTSVISIQFSRGDVNTISIKNRYNHNVTNPDATFSNNLDNIVVGLTDSFSRTYGLNLVTNSSDFELPNYVDFKGKKYKYNYEVNNVYYCPNNLIIDYNSNKVIRDYQQMERYIIFDCYILDLKEKKIINSKDNHGILPSLKSNDPFLKGLKHIKDIRVIKNKSNGNKTLYIKTHAKDIVEIELDKTNRIIRYKNNNIRKLETGFLAHSRSLMHLEANNVIKIEDNVLSNCRSLQTISLERVNIIGQNFLRFYQNLKTGIFPKYFFISDGCFGWTASFDAQVIGIKNEFINKLNDFDIYGGTFKILPYIVKSTTRNIVKATNVFSDKTQINFEDDQIKIVSIEKSSNFARLLDSITKIEEPTQEFTEEKGKAK